MFSAIHAEDRARGRRGRERYGCGASRSPSECASAASQTHSSLTWNHHATAASDTTSRAGAASPDVRGCLSDRSWWRPVFTHSVRIRELRLSTKPDRQEWGDAHPGWPPIRTGASRFKRPQDRRDGFGEIPRFGEANVVVLTIACVEPRVDHPDMGEPRSESSCRCPKVDDLGVLVAPQPAA